MLWVERLSSRVGDREKDKSWCIAQKSLLSTELITSPLSFLLQREMVMKMEMIETTNDACINGLMMVADDFILQEEHDGVDDDESILWKPRKLQQCVTNIRIYSDNRGIGEGL